MLLCSERILNYRHEQQFVCKPIHWWPFLVLNQTMKYLVHVENISLYLGGSTRLEIANFVPLYSYFTFKFFNLFRRCSRLWGVCSIHCSRWFDAFPFVFLFTVTLLFTFLVASCLLLSQRRHMMLSPRETRWHCVWGNRDQTESSYCKSCWGLFDVLLSKTIHFNSYSLSIQELKRVLEKCL